ncbi:energy transducer TonB [Frateuria aurantia]
MIRRGSVAPPQGSSLPPLQRRAPDILGACILLSLIVHAMLLLGLSFRHPAPPPPTPSMDVTLLQATDAKTSPRADFLAQANNQGGGDSDRVAKPSEPVAGLLPTPEQGTAPQPVEASMARQQDDTRQQQVTTTADSDTLADDTPSHTPHDTPDATADETREAQQMATLAAELSAQSQAYAKRPRKKFISANTREYAYAAYMQHWVQRIERDGNLNYPAVARARHLYGELILSVGLRRNGEIASVDIIQPSGHPELDQAAERIVYQAAPYPPLPADKQRVDLLYITRTWQFLPGDRLNAQ